MTTTTQSGVWPRVGRTAAVLCLTMALGTAGAPAAGAHTTQGNATMSNDGAHPWPSNGCGPNGGGWAVPDRKHGVYDFNHACDHHDGGYIGFPRNGRPTYWASRRQVDEWFLQDMLASCREYHGSNWGRTRNAQECKNRAFLYYQAVRDYGHRWYRGPAHMNN